jgi:transcriptional regulator with XRE-family HTH domain
MAELRRTRGWSARRLAEEMAEAGMKWDRSTVANTENGRRPVTVEELLALAYVLDVAPVHLLVPPVDGEGADYAVTPTVTATSGRVRSWIIGRHPLAGADVLSFMRERPRHPWVPSEDEQGAVVRDLAPGLLAMRWADGDSIWEWHAPEEEES